MARTLIDPSLTPAAGQNVQNLLINGGLEFWQRNTSFSFSPSAPISTYHADRWKTGAWSNGGTTPTYAISRESTEIDSGVYSLKMNITVAGTSMSDGRFMYYSFESSDAKALRGKTLSLSMRVKSNNSTIRGGFGDDSQFFFTGYHTGDNTWQTLTATGTILSNTNNVGVWVGIGSGGNYPISTSYIDSVMLVIGSQPIGFVSKPYGLELAQCQRYCAKFGGITNQDNVGTGFHIASTAAYIAIVAPVLMRATPTVTVVNATNFRLWSSAGGSVNVTSLASLGAEYNNPYGTTVQANTAGGLTQGAGTILRSDATSYILLEADI